MAGKKSSRGPVANLSAIASSKVPDTTAKKSSILRSSFAPSEFQLSLFASVIQGFDSQQLRVHDINTGRLRCEYSAGAGAQINSLDWGYYSAAAQHSPKQNKKRKRQQTNGTAEQFLPEQAVIALATSESDIRLFSPSEGKILATLKGGHERDVKQFKFTEGGYSEGWSIGDAKLVQWDITTQKPIRTISLPTSSISVLARPTLRSPQIICASSIPYAIDLVTGTSQETTNFDAFKDEVHTLLRSGVSGEGIEEHLLAGDADRYINLYNIQQRRLVKTLVAEFEVEAFTTSNNGEILAATTKNGLVQLFAAPFAPTAPTSSGTPRKGKRQGPSRPNATIRLVRPEESTKHVPLLAAVFDGEDIVFSWVESGVSPAFDRVKWGAADGGGVLAFEGIKDVVRGRSSSLLNSVSQNGVHEVGKTYVDDSQAVVTQSFPTSADTAAVDAEKENESEEEESDEGDAARQLLAVGEEAESSAEEDEDEEMVDAGDASDAVSAMEAIEETEGAEPSFGEMLAQKHPEPIAIASSLIPTDPDAVSGLKKDLTIPSGLSLATVLTQSLRTNDQNLLESCFHTTDTTTVRLTIQRLDSSLAATLLQKLADRLSRRPGRYGHLLVWVQWVCVAHGGAIAGRRDVLEKIQSLFRVLNQRANSLDNLLLLKGKLDMLDAQIGLRKQMQSERHARAHTDRNEEDVIYIEGQEESSSDEDEANPLLITGKPSRSKGPSKSLQELIDEDAESEDDEDMPMANGIASGDDSDAESEESYEQKEGGVVDDEAEESHPSDDDLDRSGDEEGESEDEDDSEMDDFINDDPISDVSIEEDDLELDNTPDKPPSKKNRRK